MAYTIKIKFGKKMAKLLFAAKPELLSSLEEDALLEMLKRIFAAKPELMSSLEEDSFAEKFLQEVMGAKPYKVTRKNPFVASRRQIENAVDKLFVPAEGKVEMPAHVLRKAVEREIGLFVDEFVLESVLEDSGYKSKIVENDLFYLLDYNKDETVQNAGK